MFALNFCYLLVLLSVLWFVWRFHRILLVAYRVPAVPGVRAYPVIGHVHYIRLGYTGLSNYLVRMLKYVAREAKSSTVVVWAGLPIFAVFDPEDIQTVLNSSATHDKGPEIHAMKYAVGNGILTATWSYWKVLRRHLNPLFHTKNLSHLVPVINKCGRDLTLNLSRHVGKGQVDVQHYVNDAALASTCNLLFGSDFKVAVGSKPFKKMNDALESISLFLAEKIIKFWLWSDFVFNTLHKKRILELETSFKEYFREPLLNFESRRELNSLETISNTNNYKNFASSLTTGVDKTNLTIVDVYTQLQKNVNPHFSTTDFRKEIVSFMLAGSETTKATVSSCLLALSVHPEIQERLYTEVASVMGNEDEDDLTLPAGSTVAVCLAAVHHDPRFYPDPDRFDPDHFLPERVAARPKYAFVPFSGGPRGCIGKHYSMMTVKTFVVHVLRKYKLLSDVDINSLNNVPGLAFSFLEGYQIQFEHR